MNFEIKPVTPLRHLIGKNCVSVPCVNSNPKCKQAKKHWKAVSSYGADDVIIAVTDAAAAAYVVAVAAAGLKVAFISFICFYFTLCKSFEALTSF